MKISSILKRMMIGIVMLLIASGVFFSPDQAHAKSSSSNVSKTNKNADKAYMKKVKSIYRKTAVEWNDQDYRISYLFTDLTGDGIHEAIISYRHNEGGSGGYEFAVYSYVDKKAKRVLLESGAPEFAVYKKSKTLVVSDNKKGWEWYDCYKFNGKKYVHKGGIRRYYDEKSNGWTLSDEEYYSVLNENCSGKKTGLPSSKFKEYKEKNLKDTGYSGENVYVAYLNLIRGEKDRLDKHYSYYRDYAKDNDRRLCPVAIADVYGDDTPELIYFEHNDAYGVYSYIHSDMYIATYEDGHVKLIFDKDRYGSILSGGYYLFKEKGEKTLYMYTTFGDEWWEDVYYAFEDDGNGLSIKEIYRLYANYDYNGNIKYEYYRNGSEKIAKKEYDKAVDSLLDNTSELLNFNSGTDFVKGFISRNGCSAMTSDEAIKYLKKLAGIDPNAKADNAFDAYRDFVLDREFMNVVDTNELDSDFLTVTFGLYDMNGDDSPELFIFNGFNGKNMRANYVFTYSGGEVVYCGNTSMDSRFGEWGKGLFAGESYTGVYVEDIFPEYADKYESISTLNSYSLDGTVLKRERVWIYGYTDGINKELLYRTEDDELFEVGQNASKEYPVMSWKELNQKGWDSLVKMYEAKKS